MNPAQARWDPKTDEWVFENLTPAELKAIAVHIGESKADRMMQKLNAPMPIDHIKKHHGDRWESLEQVVRWAEDYHQIK